MKKWLCALVILTGGLWASVGAQNSSRVLLEETHQVKNDPELVRQFMEKSKNFQRRTTSSGNDFQQVRSWVRKKDFIAAAPSLSNLKLNGAVVYDENRDVNTFGIYSFSAQAPVIRKEVTLIPRLSAGGGAIYSDGKLYVYDYSVDYGFVSSSRYTVYDAVTGEELTYKNMGYDLGPVYRNAAVSCAKDPVSGTVYCCSYGYNDQTRELCYILSTWNLEGMAKDSIALLSKPMQVMACASDGKLYGISASTATEGNNGGVLYEIDKTTGALREIGDTQVSPKYTQSAVINPADDTFYWFANEEDEAANLYTVDLTTGTATLIGALPYGDQVVGAYIPDPEAADGAPSTPGNLSVSFEHGALSGTVSFDIPGETYSGAPLTGPISYKISGNGSVLATGEAEAGTRVDCPVTVPASALYKLEVVLTNSVGDSPVSDVTLYIGKDAPLAVNNLTVVRTGDVNTVTWNTPVGTKNGGYMDKADLRYKIVRMPDNVQVAENHADTIFSETFTTEELALYSYVVTPYNDGIEGESATSNSVSVGEALTPPYEQDFTDKNALGLFTVVDVNGDGKTWSYSSGTVRYSYHMKNQADDWLITPPLKLQQGYEYEFSFDTYVLSSRSEEKMEVKMGTAATVEAMNMVVMEERTYTNTRTSPKTETFSIKPEADGVYYIGFHAVSDANKGNLTLDNIRLGAPVSANVPGAVENLTLTPGAQGALSVTIDFTAPTRNLEGGELTELTAIDVRRGETLVKTFENPETGAALQLVDNDVAEGENVYQVVARNSFGEGAALLDTVWVGIDEPLAPQSVTFVDHGDGTGLLSWSEVSETGKNGGYVNPREVVYTLYDADRKVEVEGVEGLQYELDALNNSMPQVLTYFSVVAQNGKGVSEATQSNSRLVGPSYPLPYTESFAGAEVTHGPWTTELLSGKSYDSSWDPRPDQSQDNDGGSADFQAYAVGASTRIYSPKIDISTVDNPRLNAWILIPTGGVRVRFQVSVDYADWTDVETFETADEWTRINVDLAPYKSKNLRLALVGECVEDFNFAYVDNIEIRNYLTDNLQAVAITGPAKADFKKEAQYAVTVLNEGVNEASRFTVDLVDSEDRVLASKSVESLASQGTVNVEIPYTPSIEMAGTDLVVYGVVKYDLDQNLDDNRTATAVTTRVNGSSYPVATGLTGRCEGSAVRLSWTAPSLDQPVAETVTDGFEDYDPFTVNGFGAWTVADVDGGNTYVFGESQAWPNAGAPQAFMIFDVTAEPVAGLGVDERFMMDATHGSKLAVCWSSDPKTTQLGHNDDWLISPRLAAEGQTVSFQAKAYDAQYAESMEVYYSTTGNAVEDFTNNLDKVASVPADEWTTYTYELPAEATYFAIRCVSENAFLLGIDNVTYKPQPVLPEGLTVESYNVYRNGELLGNTASTEYSDETPGDEDNVYAVSVVYNLGESILSAPCTVGTSGIESDQLQGCKVYVENGAVVICGAAGNRASISDLSGVLLYSEVCSDVTTVPLNRGIYIVRLLNKSIKVIVD